MLQRPDSVNEELTCNKCWFNTIQPYEPYITDTPKS